MLYQTLGVSISRELSVVPILPPTLSLSSFPGRVPPYSSISFQEAEQVLTLKTENRLEVRAPVPIELRESDDRERTLPSSYSVTVRHLSSNIEHKCWELFTHNTGLR